MKFLLALLLLLPGIAGAAGRVSAPLGGGTFTNGQSIQGKNATFETLASTGTAPSATLNGVVSNASVTVLSGGLAVAGQSGMVVRIGTITNTAGSNPTQLSLGGPYNNVTAGNTTKSKLLVYDDGTSGAGLSFSSTGGGTMLEYNTSSGFDHAWHIGGSEKMRLKDTTGNLGIGTASPGSKLHVSGGTVTVQGAYTSQGLFYGGATLGGTGNDSGEIRVGGGITSGFGGALGVDGNTTSITYLGSLRDNATDKVQIRTRVLGTPVVALTAIEGQIGIGTASPGARLHVAGAAGDGMLVHISSANGAPIWQVNSTGAVVHSMTGHTDTTTGQTAHSVTLTPNGSNNAENFGITGEIAAGYAVNQYVTGIMGRAQKSGGASAAIGVAGIGTRNGGTSSQIGVFGFGGSSNSGDSASDDFGGYFAAQPNAPTRRSVGLMSVARYSAGTANYGGYFALRSDGTTATTPNGIAHITPNPGSAALAADNRDQAASIILGLDNGTTVFQVIDGGLFEPVQKTTLQISLLVPTRTGQYVDNSTIGKLCRSTGTAAGNFALATDNTAGCF